MKGSTRGHYGQDQHNRRDPDWDHILTTWNEKFPDDPIKSRQAFNGRVESIQKKIVKEMGKDPLLREWVRDNVPDPDSVAAFQNDLQRRLTRQVLE